ncbi:hypothetical protein AK812_SmicGene21857 [Symbiodinium microadriaticum]|uniref:Uncharacterized protein n=1 Tax=Symbiodinium microadriaticum TaxID=2951 RepID=A0A1Q9DLB4_SYMMI|nr:hypothetical protein AK812_SmicGene21857 [Symbiodinium microadriaticum]
MLKAYLREERYRVKAGTTMGQGQGVVGSGGTGGLQNLIRAYQVRGHEAANLDPLGLHGWRKWSEKVKDLIDLAGLAIEGQSHI